MQLTHQDVYKEFPKGKFKVEMSIRKFSRIAANENHEQMNAKFKRVSGTNDLTENEMG